MHPIKICNGIEDCVFSEDEYLCDLPYKCPKKCQCLMYFIYCSNDFLLLSRSTSLINNAVFIKLINVTSNMLDRVNNTQTGNSLVAIIWCSSSLNNICVTNFSSVSVRLVDFS